MSVCVVAAIFADVVARNFSVQKGGATVDSAKAWYVNLFLFIIILLGFLLAKDLLGAGIFLLFMSKILIICLVWHLCGARSKQELEAELKPELEA